MSDSLPNPVTREEEYLYNIAQGNSTGLPEPITNVEKYLHTIAQNGGGSDLPEVTDADNGKVLKVVEGVWDKGEAGGGSSDFVVEFTLSAEGDVTTETPIDDIITAITAGQNVRCIATQRIDIDESQYLLNVMNGGLNTYSVLALEEGDEGEEVLVTTKYVMFDVFLFGGDIKTWDSSTIAGQCSVEGGVTSEDSWSFVTNSGGD